MFEAFFYSCGKFNSPVSVQGGFSQYFIGKARRRILYTLASGKRRQIRAY